MTEPNSRPLVLTMGEPAGVGPELALKAWAARDRIPPFIYVGDADHLAGLAAAISPALPTARVTSAAEGRERFPEALPVLHEPLKARPQPGRPTTQTAAAVIAAVDRAVELVRNGDAAAVVTNPVHKKTLWAAGVRFPGHTEYLAEIAARMSGSPANAAMMLVVPGLRVVPVTVHIPLCDVARTLRRKLIVDKAVIAAEALRHDFGIARPRLAVAALNPHAGEDGALGREEIDIIAPAVADLETRGLSVDGPRPADTLFHEAARSRYDAVICMYHDQALIPLKTIDFYAGVNVTLGLPFVRTSPDHGTAFDVAGKGTADPTSLLAALKLAGELGRRRGLT